MIVNTLGLVECRSIAGGIFLTDQMVKAAHVELIRAATICPGRYYIQIAGDRASVDAAISTAEASRFPLSGCFVLNSVHPNLVRGVRKCQAILQGDAIGVVECRTASAGVVAADQVLKGSAVDLAQMVIGQGIAGKSYFIINGGIADITEATAIAGRSLDENLLEAVVIPAPDKSVIDNLMNKAR
ncbi:MAG: BMC domain-containing protein [Anaerolineales bacterium]|nr:BMC domain-containing protein [Anaerolineales bacterium]